MKTLITMYKIKTEVKTVKIEKLEKEVSFSEYIAIRLKELRGNINQEDLAKELGITRTSLSNIENAKQGLTLKLLEKICKYYGIKSNEILPF